MLALILGAVAVLSLLYIFRKGTPMKETLPPSAPSSLWRIMTGSGLDRLSHFQELSEWCQRHFKNKSESGAAFIITAPIFGFGSHTVLCCDYKLARLILSGNASGSIKESEKTTLTQNLNMFDNVCSLLTYLTADPQRIQSRKFIAPSFSTSNLQKTTQAILYDNVHSLMHLLDEHTSSGAAVDIKQLSVMVIFDILTKSLFNVSLRDEASGVRGFDYAQFLRAQDDSMREAVKRLLIPFRRYMGWLQAARDGARGREKLVEFARVVLHAYLDSKGLSTASDDLIREHLKDEKSIMAHIICNSYPTEEHRLSDVIVFLIAGHETTAHTLSFVLYCLVKNPHAQATLRAHLDAITPSGPSENGERPSLLTLGDISRCDYLTHCLKESQRLYPVAPLISRRTLTDIEHNGMTIPQNSTVLVCLRSMFRQQWIDRPEEFVPERWDEDAPQAAELKDMFLPFSIGKRSCIGQNLALMELRVLLANIIRNFDLELVGGDPQLDYFVTLKPVELRMKVSRR